MKDTGDFGQITFITPTDETGASSRYRVYQLLDRLKATNYAVYPFLNQSDYQEFKNGSLAKVIAKVPSLIFQRITLMFKIKNGSLVFIHRDIIPFGPMVFERILKLKNCSIILDLDDAVYCNEIEEISSKKNHFAYKLKYGKRFDSSIRLANLVICGNHNIEKHAKNFNSNTTIIPTLIDTDKIKPKKYTKPKRLLTVGWIGNPGNTKYIFDVLSRANQKRTDGIQLSFILIGAKKFETSRFENLNIKFYDWSQDTEYDLLRRCDVGIMPLNDTEWSKGKCGLKLLQYMAAGIPGIGSDVGMNKEIIIEGKNGWLVKNNDWNEAFNKVIQNLDNLSQMGKFARNFVEENYSINRYEDKYNQIIREMSKR